MHLFSILEDSAKKWPEDTAVVHDGRSLRYRDLFSAAESLAQELRALGMEEGDKVGVMFPNGPEYIAVAFAVLRIGAIVVSIPPVLKVGEVASFAKEMALDGFCCSDRFVSLIPRAEYKNVACRVSIFSGRDPLFLTRTRQGVPQSERELLLEIKAATIRSSSGTTGKAKGIIVSHDSLLERAKTYCEAPPLQKGDNVLWLRPMARPEIYAFVLQGTKIVIGDAMDTRSLARLTRQHSVTHIYAGPMFYRMMSSEKDIAAEDLRGVRYFLSGGSALGKQIADAFAVRYGREIIEHYGLAECATVLINLSQDPSRRGSVGKPFRAEVKLVSAGGSQLDGEGTGDLLVRSPGLFDAYYKPWRLRDEVLEDGWFRTGDIARRDSDGYYWIVGRTKEVINVGGVKVFPYEVEKALLTHPAVEEAMVFGAPEPRFGEVPHAKVKLRSGAVCVARELLRYVNERLSVFKALRSVEFVDEIPKTVTGKPKRTG